LNEIKSITMKLLLSLFVLLGADCSQAFSAETKRPKILYILVDDQSPFDLTCHNPQSPLETPNIDRLARDGMLFENACHMGAVNHTDKENSGRACDGTPCFAHGCFGSHEAQSGHRQVLPAVITAWQTEKIGVDCLHAQTAADHSRYGTQWSDVGSTKQKGT